MNRGRRNILGRNKVSVRVLFSEEDYLALDKIADLERTDVSTLIRRAVALTGHNSGMTLNLAFNYTGRAEIIDAVRHLIDSGELFLPEMCRPELDEKLFSRYLYTDGMPDVDLVIRTADELRLSNFLLWQTAYSEYYFTPVFWPDFDRLELEKALKSYNQRRRRFGGD